MLRSTSSAVRLATTENTESTESTDRTGEPKALKRKIGIMGFFNPPFLQR